MADLLLGRTVDEPPSDVSVATSDLVTHGVIVGMTGSGKTGLGVVLIEECLASGVPTILIDPKGDLTNLALVFPGLTGPEFEPWVDPAQAKAEGTTVAEFAEKQAGMWRDGLAQWGVDPAQLAAFKAAFDVVIYTPGSSAGIPVNVLGSLNRPATNDPEIVNDEIEGYVTSLLGVVGIAADPLSSREHILLSNIISAAWSGGENIDLPTLLARVQQPPMRKLGVFELDTFFPPKDRMAFALRLNAVLAAPGFQSWITGEPIDIEAMLRAPDGRPRCAVVTTAHLSDEDRQNATSLILSKIVTWMRRQSGTTDLRALLYMDEVAGYLPPTATPPTKKPIMLLMKQARAFGLGVVLSTQNPVDVDYKALSNAGTWMIGRLTTERDKSRLLDGMSSAAGGVDIAAVGDRISGLGKRQFLLRKAGANDVGVFGTKWARSYLRGPMTRDQIAAVTKGAPLPPQPAPARPVQPAPIVPEPQAVPPLAEPGTAAAAGGVTAAGAALGVTPAQLSDDETPVMPKVADGVSVAFLDPAAPWAAAAGAVPPGPTGPRLAAGAAARVLLRYDEPKADLLHDEEYEAVIVPVPAQTAALTPIIIDYDDRDLRAEAPAGARYALPSAPVDAKQYWTQLSRDLTDHLVRSKRMEVLSNPALKLYSRAGETQEQFAARCQQAAAAEADKKTAALQTKYQAKLRSLQTRLATAAQRADAAAAARTNDVVGSVGGLLGSLLGGRRSTSGLATAARRAQTAQNRLNDAAAKVDEAQQQINDVEAQLTDEVYAISSEWQTKAAEVTTVAVPLEKTDVRIADLRLLWVPVG